MVRKKGISQSDFAEESKVSRTTISKLCNNNEYIPSASTLKRIMRTARTIDKNKKANDFFDI
ncbi:helix-turn-helix transcriptional regulator [Priestia aryabhattai]|uniref:helix-turn-helix transcriptional regulator n=1 Tax=Priestia aryabhattai TaxID=412384 RepID=UPI003CF23218